ncbi:MAG TPA: M20/M25/M40 family metallo-hydrolase [Vicinamibacterales bacterium]|nr:M20/M25/M40 family metallo-hydrolase [Vicinamibacterales bacterium]
MTTTWTKSLTPLLFALLVVVATPSTAPAQEAGDHITRDPQIVKLLGAISPDRLIATVRKLQSFHTRNLMSETDSPTRGIGAARRWIFEQFKSYSPRLQVSYDTYEVAKQGPRLTRNVELRNVMAILPGRTSRRIYISGHYDSVARIPEPADKTGPASASSGRFDWVHTDNYAPGANDDASGVALTMELARVFSQSGLHFNDTIVFIAFAGEEEGLIGSWLHAHKAAEEKLVIDADLNNDIVGDPSGGNGLVDSSSVRVFSVGPMDSPSRELARYVWRMAGIYIPSHRVELIARQDRFGRGGDHSSFNEFGYAAVRFTTSMETFTQQHSVLDTADHVSPTYLADNARVNAAAAANLALAPPAPVVLNEHGRAMIGRGPTGYDAELHWQPSPGAVGYRVVWRSGWSLDWQHAMRVGNVTEVVLPGTSIDDYIFGVAAIGPDGHESLVSAYVNPPFPARTIKTLPLPSRPDARP